MVEMKVVVRVWILKEMIVHLYFLNCWMFCDQTWYVSVLWPDAESREAYLLLSPGKFCGDSFRHSLNWDIMFAGSGNQWFKPFDTTHFILVHYLQLAMQMKWPCNNCVIRDTVLLRASLSGTFLQTLPDLVTPLKGHSLSPHSCPLTWSVPSERFGYW